MLSRALLLALPLALLAGCGKGDPLLGKWTGTMMAQPVEIEYRADKTLSMAAKGPQGADLSLTGTYSSAGDKLTQTFTKYDLQGIPAAAKPMVEAGMKGIMNKPSVGTFKIEGDTLTVTPDGGAPQTLTRVKAAS